MRYLPATILLLATSVCQAQVLTIAYSNNAASTAVTCGGTGGYSGNLTLSTNTSTAQTGNGPADFATAFTFPGGANNSTGYSIDLGGNRTMAAASIPLTYSEWLWISPSASFPLYLTYTSSGSGGLHITSTTVNFRCNSIDHNFTISGTVPRGRWFHLMFVRDASNNGSLYIDGKQMGSTAAVNSASWGFRYLGRNATTGAGTFNGKRSNLKVYDSDETSNLATLFAEGIADEDYDADWAGYIEATGDAPTGAVRDFTYLIQIDSSNTDFWANVQADGDDVRATIGGEKAAVDTRSDLATWDYAGESAVIAVKRKSIWDTAPVIRIYAGNPGASQVPVDDVYGQYDAYPSSQTASLPLGGGSDRTGFTVTTTPQGSVTTGGGSGMVTGSAGTVYDGTDDGYLFNTNPSSLTVLMCVYPDALDDAALFMQRGDDTKYTRGGIVSSGASNWAGRYDAANRIATATGTYSATTWFRYYGNEAATTSRKTGRNGTATEDTNTQSRSGFTIANTAIGYAPLTTPADYFDGTLSEVSIYSVTLNADWLNYDSAMFADPDQSDFYNGWTSNFGPPPPSIFIPQVVQ